LTGIFVDNQDKAVRAGQPGAGPTGVLASYPTPASVTLSGSRPGGWCFVREPAGMDYDGMDAVFDDTCGNLVNLHQD
jgi:hypothetical protein